MSPEIEVRSQYTFTTDNKTLACLLTRNVKVEDNPHMVNVVALVIEKLNNSQLNLVKIIVGTIDPNDQTRGGAGEKYPNRVFHLGDENPQDPDLQRTNKLQNKQFRENMRYLNIEFSECPVIQVFNLENVAGTPGIIRAFYTALVCANIDVINFYFGEPAIVSKDINCGCQDGTQQYKSGGISRFFQVDKLDKALRVLRNLDLTLDVEEQLCINADNVDYVCKRCPSINKHY